MGLEITHMEEIWKIYRHLPHHLPHMHDNFLISSIETHVSHVTVAKGFQWPFGVSRALACNLPALAPWCMDYKKMGDK